MDAPALASGQLVDARGQGSVAYVTREDCARVAAAALASADTGRRTLDVSGPESLTSADVATLAGEFARRPITHVSVPLIGLRLVKFPVWAGSKSMSNLRQNAAVS